jgi:hypothetical protein
LFATFVANFRMPPGEDDESCNCLDLMLIVC